MMVSNLHHHGRARQPELADCQVQRNMRGSAQMSSDVDPDAPTRTSRPDGATGDARPALRTGARIGRYVVERELGAGGMGVVVEARDPELQRQVALKLVRPDLGDRAYRQRLVREAR